MIWNGPISSVFDWVTYAVLYFIVCPLISGGLLYNQISSDTIIQSGMFSGMNMRTVYAATFQTGWLIECIWSQVLVTYVLRTPKIPIIQSRPSKIVVLVTLLSCTLLNLLTAVPFGSFFGFVPMKLEYYFYLLAILASYILFASIIKNSYIKINKSWL